MLNSLASLTDLFYLAKFLPFLISFFKVFGVSSLFRVFYKGILLRKMAKDDENIVHKLMDYRSKINETDEFDQS